MFFCIIDFEYKIFISDNIYTDIDISDKLISADKICLTINRLCSIILHNIQCVTFKEFRR